MFARISRSRITARASIAVLAAGVFALAGLALWSTAMTERATARVAVAAEVGDAWGHLFDHVNLEEDMMHAYLGTYDEAQRRAFAQTIGGAQPILDSLRHMGGSDNQIETAQAAEAYRAYTSTLQFIVSSVRDVAKVETYEQQGESAAAAVRQLVSASLASERQASRTYNEGVDRASHALRVAATTAFSICLALLAMCSAFLLGYQRRVERQAAASRHDAMHDALTGLANRTLLADRVSLAMAAGRRHGTHVGLILIDLDGFKEVNDTLGHKFGDLVLQKVAARLNATIRDGDTVARLGGDEFAILLPELASGEQATTIAERLLEVLRRPIDIEQYLLEVGASIGIAVYPTNCDSAEQLLQNADIAMYAAKRGHLGIAEYDSSQNSHHPKQLTLLAELRRALEGGEIVLHYQPKADTGTGQICGVEALARWQHPLHGLMGPLEFIPLAEQGGLIELLTIHVLAEALDQCRKWGREGLHLPVAVNISSKCLADSDFPGKVSALLSANEVAPDMLTLEITETSVISNPDQALNVLRQVRALGVRLSVDDFGTGYSSMAYLQDMPITEVKIDRCFISRMNDEDQSRAIVHAVLDLARNLNLQVVAEGVEDQQTWDELSALGCDISQGFFFSKPLPPAELADWITRQGAGRAQPVA